MMSVSPASIVLTEFECGGVTVRSYANREELLRDVIFNRGPETPALALKISNEAIAAWKEAEEIRNAPGDEL